MLQIEHVPIDTLVPASYNPRRMPDEQMAALMRSLAEFGWVDPVIVNSRTGLIVGGHQRVEAAKRLQAQADGNDKGRWALVPIAQVDLDEERERALNVALNRISGEWDYPKLAELLRDLDEDMVGLTGFSIDEIDQILAQSAGDDQPAETDGLTEPDDVPEAPEEPVTQLGDLWTLGRHRLLCGDSTAPHDLQRLMEGKLAQLVFTDPPYNVDYDPEARHSTFSPERLKRKLGKIKNDRKSPEAFRSFLDEVFSGINQVLEPGRAIYVCHADTEGHHFRSAFVTQPWRLQSCLIWKKSVLVFGRADYHWIHEPILYGWKEGASHVWHGDRKQTTVIEIATDHYNKAAADTKGYVHPTQKPVALIETALANSSTAGEIVLDAFGGSGSTLIAAEKTGRKAYLMELDPRFCDVIVRRWENFTGQKAVRHGQDDG